VGGYTRPCGHMAYGLLLAVGCTQERQLVMWCYSADGDDTDDGVMEDDWGLVTRFKYL
jgi:hypothetical protein